MTNDNESTLVDVIREMQRLTTAVQTLTTCVEQVEEFHANLEGPQDGIGNNEEPRRFAHGVQRGIHQQILFRQNYDDDSSDEEMIGMFRGNHNPNRRDNRQHKHDEFRLKAVSPLSMEISVSKDSLIGLLK